MALDGLKYFSARYIRGDISFVATFLSNEAMCIVPHCQEICKIIEGHNTALDSMRSIVAPTMFDVRDLSFKNDVVESWMILRDRISARKDELDAKVTARSLQLSFNQSRRLGNGWAKALIFLNETVLDRGLFTPWFQAHFSSTVLEGEFTHYTYPRSVCYGPNDFHLHQENRWLMVHHTNQRELVSLFKRGTLLALVNGRSKAMHKGVLISTLLEPIHNDLAFLARAFGQTGTNAMFETTVAEMTAEHNVKTAETTRKRRITATANKKANVAKKARLYIESKPTPDGFVALDIVWSSVFEYLNPGTKIRMAFVCKQWRVIISNTINTHLPGGPDTRIMQSILLIRDILCPRCCRGVRAFSAVCNACCNGHNYALQEKISRPRANKITKSTIWNCRLRRERDFISRDELVKEYAKFKQVSQKRASAILTEWWTDSVHFRLGMQHVLICGLPGSLIYKTRFDVNRAWWEEHNGSNLGVYANSLGMDVLLQILKP